MARVTSADIGYVMVEPVTGIEPAPSAWEAEVLPLNYTGGTPVGAKASLAEGRPGTEIFRGFRPR